MLPFANIGDDAASRPFGDGLVETLTTQLTQIGPRDGPGALQREPVHGWLLVWPVRMAK